MIKTLSIIPRFALYAMLVFTPLARGSVQDWAVTTMHMVTLIAVASFLLDKTWHREWRWIRTPLDGPILLLMVLSILSAIFSMHRDTSIWSIILLFNYLAVFYLVIHTVRTRSQLRQLVYLIIGIGIFLSIFGMVKRFGANPFPWWHYPELPYPPEWLSATYGNHNHMAGYLEMAIPLVFGLFLLGFGAGTVSFLVYLSLIMLTALVLTLSRGGWISSISGVFFMSAALLNSRYFKRKKLYVTITGGFLIVGLMVLASSPVVERVRTVMQKGEEASFHSRVVAWRGIVEMIGDYPLLGTGPGTFATIFTRYQPPGFSKRFINGHNDYLHFISEAGLPLIPIIIWMIVAFYRRGFRKMKNPSRLVRGLSLGAMTGITAILFHSFVDFNLHIPANALLFSVLAALVVAPSPGHGGVHNGDQLKGFRFRVSGGRGSW